MRHTNLPATVLLLLFAISCAPIQTGTEPPLMEFPGQDTDPVPIESFYRDLRRHTQRMRPGDLVHVSASADGRSFVFASQEIRGTPQIYLQAADAVVAAQITGNRASNLFPRLSPDGRFVAYASDLDGNWDIFVTRTDAPASITQLTFEETDEIAPCWSPDGTKIAFSSQNQHGVWMLVLMDWATRIPTVLGPGLYPDWSSRNWIAFQTQPARNDARIGIQMIRPDGTGLRQVNFDRGGRYSAVLPRWSSDGRWLLFGVLDGNDTEEYFGRSGRSRDLWAVQADGRNPMPLTSDEWSDEWWPSWGGSRVFFLSDRDDGYENVYSFEPRLIEPDSEGRPE